MVRVTQCVGAWCIRSADINSVATWQHWLLLLRFIKCTSTPNKNCYDTRVLPEQAKTIWHVIILCVQEFAHTKSSILFWTSCWFCFPFLFGNCWLWVFIQYPSSKCFPVYQHIVLFICFFFPLTLFLSCVVLGDLHISADSIYMILSMNCKHLLKLLFKVPCLE